MAPKLTLHQMPPANFVDNAGPSVVCFHFCSFHSSTEETLRLWNLGLSPCLVLVGFWFWVLLLVVCVFGLAFLFWSSYQSAKFPSLSTMTWACRPHGVRTRGKKRHLRGVRRRRSAGSICVLCAALAACQGVGCTPWRRLALAGHRRSAGSLCVLWGGQDGTLNTQRLACHQKGQEHG